MMHPVMERAAMADLKLTLLGGFEARTASGDVVELPGQKDRALLAYLAIAPGEPHSRGRVAGLLWSERGDQQARDSLKQSLLRLRRSLGAGDGGVLRADRRSVALDRNGIDVDVRTFERLVRDDTIDALAQAASVYRGDLLEGIVVHDPAFEDWLLIERQRLRQVFERALASLMSQALAASEREHAAEAARRLLRSDPLSEAAYRTLMQVHADEGQTAQALKLYDGLWDRLHRELGVRPEPATVALHDQIRRRRSPAMVQSQPPDESAPAPTPSKPSMAVLPFLNLSGDPEQQYFSDGITEDIITELSRFASLQVIARNSAFQYRDNQVDVRRVARELGVGYVVEGSVRRADGRIRISAQLVDATTGAHLWAERYDRDQEQVFAVQDDVIQTIVGTVMGRIKAAEVKHAKRKPPANLAAYDCVLRGNALPWGDAQADFEARRLLEKAVELDPGYGLAHALLALMIWQEASHRADESAGVLDRAFVLAKKAVELDENEATCHFALGMMLLERRSFRQAEGYVRRALELNPNNPVLIADMGELLVYLGSPDESIAWLKKAKQVDPFFNPAWYWHVLGRAHFTARRYDDAIAAFERSQTRPYWLPAYIAACHAQMGRAARATECAAEALRLRPDCSIRTIADREPYEMPGDLAHLLESLRRAGLPE